MTTHENNSKDFDLIPNFNFLNQFLYFIVDFKSLSILPPFLAQNDQEAIRNFTNLVNYSQSTLCRFPEDFKLYKYGDYTVAVTGSYDCAREELNKFVQQFDFIASADLLKQPDTIKYDELNKKVSSALEQVSNSNNVLLEQIGNVPNLEKSFNLLTSKLKSLEDNVSQLNDSESQLSEACNVMRQQTDEIVDYNKAITSLASKVQYLEDKIEHIYKVDNLSLQKRSSFIDKLFN